MMAKEQLNSVNQCDCDFKTKLEINNEFPVKSSKVDILQISVSKKCNLSCKHCHVSASSKRDELMSKDIFENCLNVLEKNPTISTIDITGGAPEMNENLEWFLNRTSNLNKRVIVRSNLVILDDDKYKNFFDIYKNNRVELFASLPSYNDKTDNQRGKGVFNNLIKIIQRLNTIGYGMDENLQLNFVHNPIGAYSYGSQSTLEKEYKKILFEKYDITFNNLYCINNFPVGRFLEFLLKSENFEDYMCDLVDSFNIETIANLMCKSTISVGYNGKLYDCDFNQMLEVPIKEVDHISKFDLNKLEKRLISVNNHCYACTAGSGSSCQGAIKKL